MGPTGLRTQYVVQIRHYGCRAPRRFGRLFFAGEHASHSYVNGAIESGRRAAAEMMRPSARASECSPSLVRLSRQHHHATRTRARTPVSGRGPASKTCRPMAEALRTQRRRRMPSGRAGAR